MTETALEVHANGVFPKVRLLEAHVNLRAQNEYYKCPRELMRSYVQTET